EPEQLHSSPGDLDEDVLRPAESLVLLGEAESILADLVLVDAGAQDLFVKAQRALHVLHGNAEVADASNPERVVDSHVSLPRSSHSGGRGLEKSVLSLPVRILRPSG